MTGNSQKPHKVIFCLGSNMPEAANAVELAIHWLGSLLDNSWATPPFSTEPEGSDIAGRPYVNALVAGMTVMEAPQLIAVSKEYERSHGRLPHHRNSGSVAIDIDLVMVDERVIDDVNYHSNYFRQGLELLGNCL